MSSISSASGLTYLTQSGGVLSNLPSPVSASTLQSASPQDVVSLSKAAIQAQQAEGLFGASEGVSGNAESLFGPAEGVYSNAQSGENTVGLPLSSTATTGSSILPGVSSADLSNATPQQTSAVNSQAVLLQQAQALFGAPTVSSL